MVYEERLLLDRGVWCEIVGRDLVLRDAERGERSEKGSLFHNNISLLRYSIVLLRIYEGICREGIYEDGFRVK